MRIRYQSKSSTNKEEEKCLRKLKTISDIKKLDKEGYRVLRNSLTNNSTSKKVMEEKLRKGLHTLNPEMRKRVSIKRIQHPNKNIQIYIFVVKK